MSNENTIVELYRKGGALVGVLCVGYTDERRLSIPLTGFLRRAALVIVTTLERIATYHDLTVALNLAAFKGDVVEFMFKHGDYEEIRNYIGAKVCEITGAQHLMLCSDDGSRADWFGKDAPPCCHDCAKAAVNFGKHLPNDFFSSVSHDIRTPLNVIVGFSEILQAGGLSPEKAKLLMQPFIQADIKNRSEGSGLGLAICKRLVEIAHGTISIKTAPGKGFSIHTEVPVDVAPEEAKQAADAPSEVMASVSNVPRRVLVVDDFSANRAVMKVMLRKMGVADIELAEDGRDALQKLEKDPAFDLVLTDLWMPVMDGAELVKGIRADARLAALKVCALTADVEVRTTFREQGFDMLLLKPVTIAKIAEVFRSLA